MCSKIKEYYEDFISYSPECIENPEYISHTKFLKIYSE